MEVEISDIQKEVLSCFKGGTYEISDTPDNQHNPTTIVFIDDFGGRHIVPDTSFYTYGDKGFRADFLNQEIVLDLSCGSKFITSMINFKSIEIMNENVYLYCETAPPIFICSLKNEDEIQYVGFYLEGLTLSINKAKEKMYADNHISVAERERYAKNPPTCGL